MVTREAGAGSGGGSGSGAGSAAGSSGPGPAIEITFERPVRGRRLFQGDLSEDGVLAFEGLGRFVTFHDDCRD